MAIIRGLNIDRSLNKKESEYHRYIDIEDMGLVIYTP